MREVAGPHREWLYQDASFHQHVEGNPCHIQLGVNEIAPLSLEHNCKVEVAIGPVNTARASQT
ncbi:MAG TPA: hypothetical protein VFE41_33390 [Acetobacteraceae bacterium]|nr:hypothetical protein [Acetobacteraceae bacterium]